VVAMSSNWLDLMDYDSNQSMTDDENTKPGIGTSSVSRASFDAELDSSRCGVNLLIKKNMNILSEDSLSRKRSLNEMKSTDIDRYIAKMSKSPPKAKQKMNAQGSWTKTKTQNRKDAVKIGFGRFLNWGDRTQSAHGDRSVLGSVPIDNKRNILNNRTSTNLVTCTPTATNRRTQYRGRRTKKLKPTTAEQSNATNQVLSNTKITNIEEEEEEDDDMNQAQDQRANRPLSAQIDNEQPLKEDENKDNAEDKEEKDGEGEGLGLGERERKETPPTEVKADEEVEPEMKEEVPVDEDEEHIGKEHENADNGNLSALETPSVAPPTKMDETVENESRENADDVDSEEDEDDDLVVEPATKSTPGRRSGRSSARVTPKLERIVFSADLLCSKVPILKKRESEESVEPPVSGPVFLNADEFAEKYPERAEQLLKEQAEEQQEEDDTDETTDCTKSDTTKSESSNSASTMVSVGHKGSDREWVDAARLRTPNSNKSTTSWAAHLFSSEKSTGTKSTREQMELSHRERKEERIHQMKIESVLPIKRDDCRMMMSRDSSFTSDVKSLHSGESAESRSMASPDIASPKSCKSNKSSTSSLQIVVPSQGATQWRYKQISYGKNTVGYKNFVKKYPNKDLRFRHTHSLVSTPDAKEKIGKKRWVGKYQKWRKFLHRFDSSDSGEDTTD